MNQFCFEAYIESSLPNPDYLFHYTKAETFTEKIMVNQTLLFNCRSNSHDPLEKDELPFVASAPTMPGSPRDNPVLRRRMDYGRELNTIRERVKYACFCVDSRSTKYYPWTKGCFRSRMWSQYTDAHKGVCLVFDRNALTYAVHNCIDKNDEYFVLSKRVRYFADLHSLYSDCEVDQRHDDKLATTHLREKSTKLLFSKIRDYRDENEYRVALYDDCDEQNFIPYGNALLGIIIGQEIDHEKKALIVEYAKEHNLPTAQVNWFVGRPEFVEINRNR